MMEQVSSHSIHISASCPECYDFESGDAVTNAKATSFGIRSSADDFILNMLDNFAFEELPSPTALLPAT
jgi:hypothetical protein